MKGKGKGSMPNSSKSGNYSDTDSGSMGSNKGTSSGLRQENSLRSDTTKQPSNQNPYPNGMA